MVLHTKANHRDLLIELIRTNFKLRYNNSILGFLWVLMKPFLYFLMLFVVFTAFRGGEVSAQYGANLLLGIIIYTLVNEGVIFGMHALTDLAGVILKVNFPRQVAVTSAVFMAVVNFGFNTVILMALAFLGSFSPSLEGLLYFAFILTMTIFALYSISLFSSILLVKIRDLHHIMELVMQLVFWGSAVFYSIDDMSGTFGQIIRLNPLALIIHSSRKALLEGDIIHVKAMMLMAIGSVVLYILGNIFFKKNIKRIAEFI
jgi:ABC-type polysaccharide/polyol phosphate export permease